jgi:ribosomal protein S18 acetylase RimI-like enzyme
MATDLIAIRPARERDAARLAGLHEEAWRYAYQGIIPHLPLSRMIAKRGEPWWREALARGMPALLLSFDGVVAGYVTFGRSRLRAGSFRGEIFELYVGPVYQGTGFGRRLFTAARQRLSASGLDGLMIWALADNDAACGFYRRLGGEPVSEGAETFDGVTLRKVAFAWR